MGCGCNSTPINSWIDWAQSNPVNPLDIIAMARLDMGVNHDVGVYLDTTTYSTPGSSWVASPFSYNGEPTLISYRTDQQGTVAEALQWNMSHLTRNSDANLAIPLRKVIFLKAGADWEMQIPLALGAGSYSDLQLSLLDNAGTRGDDQGTVPVISFTARAYTGSVTLSVSVKSPGILPVGFRAVSAAGDWSMFEMLWIIVP